MRVRRCLFQILILCGILSGLWAVHLAREGSPVQFGNVLRGIRGVSEPLSDHDDRMKRLHPGEPSLLVHQDAEFYLDLFKKHPDRFWYLWRWKSRRNAFDNIRFMTPNEETLSRQSVENQQRAAEFAATAQTLRELDPDNGYPLVLQAWLETQEGAISVRNDDKKRGSVVRKVVDPEFTAKAACLLRQAVSQEKFTQYGAEETAEWMRILGRSGTYDEFLDDVTQIASQSIPSIMLNRTLTETLVAEAARLAEGGEGKAVVDILLDLQTMGARDAAQANTFINITLGYQTIALASEEGEKILRDAGLAEEAESLLARGRSLSRPYLLALLLEDGKFGSTQPGTFTPRFPALQNDPSLLEETERLLAARRENMRRDGYVNPEKNGDTDRAGYIVSVSTPSVMHTVPLGESLLSLDELKAAARFEAWGVQKFQLFFLLILAFGIFLVLLIVYGIHSLRSGKAEQDNWPPIRQLLIGGILFGICAAGPGLLASLAGNFLWELTPRFVFWHAFWNAWGLCAACLVPAFLINCRGRRLALVGLLASAPVACLIYSGVIQPDLSGKHFSWILFMVPPFSVLALLLFPVPLWGAILLLRRAGMAALRRPQDAAMTRGLRLFLACTAGGMAVWLASYLIVDREERSWARRDTLLIPSPSNPGFPSIERRVGDFHRRHLEKVLAEEKE